MTQPRIFFVLYANPASYPPLEHASAILARRGAEVLIAGIGAPLGAGSLECAPNQRIRLRRLWYCAPGWRQKLHFAIFTVWILFSAIRFRPTVVYGSDWLACPVALILSLFWRTVYHEHDIPLAARAGSGSRAQGRTATIFIRSVLACRRLVARRAELCVAPNTLRAQALVETTGTNAPVVTVMNCPGRDEVVSRPESSRSEALTLFYHGSLVPDRLPLGLLDAIARATVPTALSIAGYETIDSPGYITTFMGRADELGLSGRVCYFGPVPFRKDLLTLCSNADVGVALLPVDSADFNQRSMAGASNKPFDYLACGLALLMSDLPEWRELYGVRGMGLSCDPSSVAQLTEKIDWFASHRCETRRMGARGRDKILADWNYETEFAKVASQLACGT